MSAPQPSDESVIRFLRSTLDTIDALDAALDEITRLEKRVRELDATNTKLLLLLGGGDKKGVDTKSWGL